MDLLPRQRKIIEILLDNREEYLSSNKISDLVGVSNKTVQSDIDVLSHVLNDFSVLIDSHRGKGYKLIFQGDDELNLLDIMTKIRKQEVHDLDVSLFLCKVLFTPLYATQQEMMDLILCSAGQLKEILSIAVLELSRHKQSIRSVPGSGFYVSGPELGRRLCFTYHLEVLAENKDAYARFVSDTNYGKSLPKVIDIDSIVQNLNADGYYINHQSYTYLKHYVTYSFIRTHHDQAVLSMQHGFPLFQGFAFKDDEVLNKLFEYNVIEKRYLNLLLQFLINESSFASRGGKLIYTKYEVAAQQIIDEYFKRRPKLFRDTFYDIEKLQEEITTSIIFMMRKNSVGFREYQLNLNEMNRSAEDIVAIEFASLLAFKLENTLKIEFFQEDIVRLAMIFSIYFYKDLWTKYKSIILYSDNSLTKARFLKRKLLSRLPYIKIFEANYLSLPQINVQKRSTLVVAEKGSNITGFEHLIVVDSFSMVMEVTQYLTNNIRLANQKNESFFKLFDQSRFHMNQDFSSRKEVVDWICERYHTSSERQDVIQMNVFAREKRYVSTVYSRAAYPKIYVDNIELPQMEVVTLKAPIVWNGEEVDVLFIAMLPNSYTSLNVLGKPFNEIRVNMNLIQKIRKVDNFECFIDLLKRELE